MENLRIRKANKRKTSALKHKLDRSSKLDGVLQSKIEQSITRAKYVQGARKAGWDQINSGISILNANIDEKPQKTDAQIEREEEDAYVDQFFKDDEETEDSENAAVLATSSGNVFAALEETEA